MAVGLVQPPRLESVSMTLWECVVKAVYTVPGMPLFVSKRYPISFRAIVYWRKSGSGRHQRVPLANENRQPASGKHGTVLCTHPQNLHPRPSVAGHATSKLPHNESKLSRSPTARSA